MKKALVGAITFVLGLSPLVGMSPAQAEVKMGGGVFTGTMAYQGDGIPIDRSPGTIWPDCRQTFFDVSLSAVVTVEHDGQTFRGPIAVVGGGGSGRFPGVFECETVDLGVGLWHLSVPLVSDDSGTTLRCAELSGPWARYGVELLSGTRGTCELNGVTTDTVNFVVAGTWTPTNVSPGTDAPANITDALLTGVITIDDDERG